MYLLSSGKCRNVWNRLFAARGSAFVTARADRTRWSIGNDVISKTVEWRAGAGLFLVALENRASGHRWRPGEPTHERAGGEFSLCWDGVPYAAPPGNGAARGQCVCGCGGGNAANRPACGRCCWMSASSTASIPGVAVIEQWLEVTPLQAGTVSRIAPLTVSVAALSSPVLHWVRGLQGHGAGMPATGPYPAFRIRHEPLGEVTLASGLRSTWHEIAWLALDNNDRGDGLFVGLLYSGRWSATRARWLRAAPAWNSSATAMRCHCLQAKAGRSPAEFSGRLSGRSRRRGPRATRVYAGRSHARHAGRFPLGAIQHLVCASDRHRRDNPAP